MADIKDRIFILLSESEFDQKYFAEQIGVKPQTISDWKAGRNRSYTKLIDKIAEFFGVTVEYLLGKSPIRHGDMEIFTNDEKLVKLPIIGKVDAGYNALAEENRIGIEKISADAISDGYEYVWLKVTGDSMSPKIEDGDLVLIRLQDEVDSGDIAIVIVDEENGVIKRVKYGTNKVTLISENEDEYPPRVFQGKDVNRVRIWGKAVDLRRKL